MKARAKIWSDIRQSVGGRAGAPVLFHSHLCVFTGCLNAAQACPDSQSPLGSPGRRLLLDAFKHLTFMQRRAGWPNGGRADVSCSTCCRAAPAADIQPAREGLPLRRS